MIYEVANDQLPQIKDELYKRIENKEHSARQLYFIAYHMINGKWTECSLFVDTWPNFNVVIARPLPEDKIKLFFCRKWHFIYSRDNSIMEEMLSLPGFINWEQQPRFYCISLNFKETIEKVCQKYGGHLDSISLTDEFHYNKDIDSIQFHIPDGFSLGPMDSSMIHMVATEWKYADQEPIGVEEYVSHLVSVFPSSCLKNNVGDVVAYTCVYENGSFGMLYVKPQHRGKGYGKIVTLDLIKKMLRIGFVPFLHVEYENLVSSSLFIKLGFEKTRCMFWDTFTKN